MRGYRIAVTEKAVAVVAGKGSHVSAVVRNGGPGVVDFGGSGVKSGEGFEVLLGHGIPMALPQGVELWAVCPQGQRASVHVLLFGVQE